MQIKNKKLLKAIVSIGTIYAATLQAAPQTEGRWSSVVDWPIIAIHAVLTPQGHVMNFGTDKNGLQGAQFFYDVWDPDKGSGANSHNTLPNTLGVDSFCSAAVVLPESGEVLMAGGDSRTEGVPNFGVNDAPTFNPRNNTLGRAASMDYARWYPTATVLPNGEVLLVGGKDGSGRPVPIPEIYSPENNQWRSVFGLSTAGYPEYYPRQWVAPDGRVFGIFGNKTMYYLNLTGNGSTQFLNKLPVKSDIFQSTSVMYRTGKILHVGGNGRITNDAVVIDIKGVTPQIRPTSRPQEIGRSWVDSVVLPNGNVMIVGGSQVENQLNGASYRPEIWNPSTERWSLMASASNARLYHSTALLLKDGRVLVAGGGAPGPLTNTNAEIFSPPYLFNSEGVASRPQIETAATETPYGAKLPITFRSNEKISRVTLIKTGAVTHSFNMEQRFAELNFTDTSSGITVDIPASPNLVTPGHYLLHLLDNKGVPSAGHMIRISNTAQQFAAVKPVANNDQINAQSGSRVTIDVLANDTGAGLIVEKPSAWSQQGGNVALADNQITYQSKQGFSGADTIWYVISDSQGQKNYAQVDIRVAAEPTSYPVAIADTVVVAMNTPTTINALANDTGSGLTIAEPNAWSSKGGNVTLTNNQIRYQPKQNYTGSDTIWYVITDRQGRKNYSQVNITVHGAGSSQYPIAVADWTQTSINTPLNINVLANDVGTGLLINEVNQYSAKGARIRLVENQLRYTPKWGFTGNDSFWYALKDNQGRTNSVKVTVYVGN
ncbi:MAG: Ig-like domain-containing protein [Leucothrix sp.]